MRDLLTAGVELVDGLEPLDLLITNQLLYQLSYTSGNNSHYSIRGRRKSRVER